MTDAVAFRPRVIQRIDTFVGRTTNWLYDHLRCIPRHESRIFCDELANRQEFPLLEARPRRRAAFSRRVWHRLVGDRPYPSDARWLRQARPIALHSHFGYVATGDAHLQAFLDVPWLVSFYGVDVYEMGHAGQWQDEYARLFERIHLALALGPEMARELECIGCPRSKIVVHALGVDVDAIPNRERVLGRGDAMRILYAGTFREKKGVEYLIRGAAEARRRGVRLEVTLVGDAGRKPGDEATKFAIFREIEQLEMEDVVIHHSYVPFDRLIEMALASHVFVAPSVTSAEGDKEGTPFVLQQMMATGIPVVATSHSDIPFIFGEHRDRLLAERDSAAIATRLQEYWEAPDELTRDGNRMRAQICSAFGVRTRAAALSGLYDRASGSQSDAGTGRSTTRPDEHHGAFVA